MESEYWKYVNQLDRNITPNWRCQIGMWKKKSFNAIKEI